MSIFDQIVYWWEYDGFSLIFTILFSFVFFNGVLPVWIDNIKSFFKDDSDDFM